MKKVSECADTSEAIMRFPKSSVKPTRAGLSGKQNGRSMYNRVNDSGTLPKFSNPFCNFTEIIENRSQNEQDGKLFKRYY